MQREAVVAEHLAKLYEGKVWGVVDATFTSYWGEVTVLLGPNGAGKTTTVGMLTTLLKPTRGRGFVAGFDIVKDVWEVRKRIALVPQEARIDPNLTPFESVKWYLVSRGWSISDAERRAKEVLEKLGLWEVRNRTGWALSGGQRKKTVTAMILAAEAEVVFLDEPTTGLDVESKYAVWGIIREEASRNKRAIIFTTHDMREAELLADRAVFISKGRVVAEGSPSKLREALPYQYKLVVRKPRRPLRGLGEYMVNVGDTTIIYTRSRSEAAALLAEIDAESISLEQVSFEDVYLYYVRRAGG